MTDATLKRQNYHYINRTGDLMKMRICAMLLTGALMVCAGLLTGCANLSAVRTYADETKKLTAAFDPMLSGSTSSCVEKLLRKKMITSRNFEAAAAEKAAKELCGPVEEDNKIIAELNALLAQYADTLAALANDKLPSYAKELDGLQDSLAKVKRSGSQENLLNADKLAALTSLTDLMSQLATRQPQRTVIGDLLSQEEGIAAITGALKDYATLNYRAWLRDEKREIRVLLAALAGATKKEPLAANYIKTLLLTEERQIDGREKAVDAFVRSIDELQKSHAELRLKLHSLDDKELLARLLNFANEVAKLRRQVGDAF